jgi:outer membrane immunogenic protein
MIILTTKGKTYMKNFMIAAALGTATLATPAFAGDFSGPRLEVTAGADDVTKGVDTTDVTYGAALGYDLQFGKVVVGAEATAANVFEKADLGAAARLGYTLNKNVLAYTRVGYTNLERPQTCTGTRPVVCRTTANLEGLTVGGGLEVKLVGATFARAEYRYTDFDGSVGRHGGLVGLGLRF